MRHRLFVHVVWTTRDRLPSLDAQRAAFLMDILPRLALRERGRILELGMVSTHLHVLIRCHPTTHLPRLVQLLKGTSATVARRDHRLPIQWAKGYNIESVSVRALGAVTQYLRLQPEHHPSDAIPGFDSGSLGLIPSLRSGHGPGSAALAEASRARPTSRIVSMGLQPLMPSRGFSREQGAR